MTSFSLPSVILLSIFSLIACSPEGAQATSTDNTGNQASIEVTPTINGDRLSAAQVASYTLGVNLFKNSIFTGTKQLLEATYFMQGVNDALKGEALITDEQVFAVLEVTGRNDENTPSKATQSYAYGVILVRESVLFQYKEQFDLEYIGLGIADEYFGRVEVSNEQLDAILEQYLDVHVN